MKDYKVRLPYIDNKAYYRTYTEKKGKFCIPIGSKMGYILRGDFLLSALRVEFTFDTERRLIWKYKV